MSPAGFGRVVAWLGWAYLVYAVAVSALFVLLTLSASDWSVVLHEVPRYALIVFLWPIMMPAVLFSGGFHGGELFGSPATTTMTVSMSAWALTGLWVVIAAGVRRWRGRR